MKALAIAQNTFREAVQDRLVYSFFFVGLIMIAGSHFFAQLSAAANAKVVMDTGLAVVYFIGVMMAVFASANSLSREVDEKRIYAVFSKPVSRPLFILGKYLGIAAAILFNVSLLGAALIFFVRWETHIWHFNLIPAIAMMYLQLLVLSSFALFFSTVSSHFLALFMSMIILLAGNLVNDLKFYGNSPNPMTRAMSEALYRVIPNFSMFDIKGAVVHQIHIDPAIYSGALLYALGYAGMMIALAMIRFGFRDFE